ncbi:MAG: NHLP bacteriocin system secretion protein [Xenococcaceae cyanobacterium MO_188.B19]|nr:NHLP bacteriocin system secretion protein [Xenococcaceae cyanobacterium MO_188.B19]
MENNSIKPSASNSRVLGDPNQNNVRTIKVLIVDAQNSGCQNLKALLDTEVSIEVVGTTTNGASGINLIESLQPDVVLLDGEIPVIDGFEIIEIIVARFPGCKILVLSDSDSPDKINRVLKAGARGYLLKSTPIEDIVNGIRSASKDYFQLSPGLFTKIFHRKLDPEYQQLGESSEPTKAKNTVASQEDTKLFREKSLERLSSPERLDQLMRVVNPKSWIPLATLGLLGVTAITWSIFGRIPVTVKGVGVLVYPSTVVPLQSQSSGQLMEVKVKNGDLVEKGDIIAIIDQSDREKQLQLTQAKLAQLKTQNLEAKSVQAQRQQEDLRSILEQRQSLEQRLKIVQDLTPTLKEKGLVAINRQRETLAKRRRTLQELNPIFQQRLDKRRILFQEGAISEDTLLQARQEFLNNISGLDQVESELKQLDVKEADGLQQYLSNLNEIKNIKAQLQELNSKQANLTQQDLANSTNRAKEIQEVEREIAQLQQQIKTESQIVSQYSGRILEMTVNPGEVIQAGNRIASIDRNNEGGQLTSITYFPVQEGKKIESGMEIQITPKTVKRERFGGIIGDIKDISPFPVTTEAASKVVGNSQIIRGLVPENQPVVIQVSATLQSDDTTFSNYKWSSSTGPQLKLSAGTTTSARVKVEERAPITFVLPILRSVSGIY